MKVNLIVSRLHYVSLACSVTCACSQISVQYESGVTSTSEGSHSVLTRLGTTTVTKGALIAICTKEGNNNNQ